MKIVPFRISGLEEALFGIGLSFGLTSGEARWESLSESMQGRLKDIASRLCTKGGGEDKFLRQAEVWWDATLPRFVWQEADQYRIGVTTQSESTMHRITGRRLTQADFEEPLPEHVLAKLNECIDMFNMSKGDKTYFMELKNSLPEGFLQRRVWTLSLANMKNIHAQRRRHRLPQWREICAAFERVTPDYLRRMYASVL